MASNYTENYGLCQWEATDNFVRTEFNQDNAKIDAALKALEDTKAGQVDLEALSAAVSGKADQTALESLSDTVALKGRIKAGTYAGTGSSKGDSQRIEVGFPVQAVLIEDPAGLRAGSDDTVKGGLAVSGGPLTRIGLTMAVVSGTGFTVYHNDANTVNRSGNTYYYVAFG